jgi:hypothetical protein
VNELLATGPEGRDSPIGIERLDGWSINFDDESAVRYIVLSLSKIQMFAAGVDALLHYRGRGARRRDPNPFFDTLSRSHLANNLTWQQRAHPLDHYQAGAREGRVDPFSKVLIQAKPRGQSRIQG